MIASRAITMRFWLCAALFIALAFAAGCSGPSSKPDLVWGKRGVNDGMFVRPRAAAIGPDDRLYIVDYTARIQVFDLDGNYVGPTWTTPDYRNGRPSSLSIGRDGNLIVCDSHYQCVRIYSPQGEELRKIGGTPGHEPGQFGYVSACVQDEDRYFYISEFDLNERITKMDADGKVVKTWGKQGSGEGEFSRIRGLALGPDKLLYVSDTINHRIQVFTRDGEFVRMFGEYGDGPGQLKYPYKISFGPNGDLYVVEYENHRVQKFSRDGQSLGTWGTPGRDPGQLHGPWDAVVDRKGRVHVLDTENHRVQRISF
jgi:DNA-binding beta-propeller fold protein YncE